MNPTLTTDIVQGLVVAAIVIVPLWKIHEKAGFPPALSLVAFIPWIGLVISPLILAFVPWPTLKKIKNIKGSEGG